MGRQLVVCLDGTGNRFSYRPTNIVRIFRSLSTRPEELLSYYDQGVGTFGRRETLFEWQKLPSRVCGLAFGWGVKRNVEGAYRFLAQNWAPDDEVFAFGFSRGAYAVRALAALIHAVGLLPAHEVHLFDYAWAMLLARDGPEHNPDFELQARFKSTFSRTIRIHFLGLYDTVKSVGWIYDPVVIPYTADNPAVRFVRHAVSIDERRCFFRQHLWHARPSSRTDVEEVWFAGVHSDIGGGYPPEQAQLALLCHRWMLGEALSAGLRVDRARCWKYMRPAIHHAWNPCAEMHNSMTTAWKLAEWLPRLVWDDATAKRSLKVGTVPPFGTARCRTMPTGALVHRSVEERIAGRSDYKPENLPQLRRTVDDDPRVADILQASVRKRMTV
ncbi:T6SS phospholipase effector Tle1-like catalytic domain-containing protein [Paraburkholderia dilworthii]|uniref:T6SS phospholipase effector Tle1-like catalytic domain-containing protein n=1 Tax=Paraburkholderia dilworthii TaxID=948106 RepID=UPI000413AE9F|nr:DUF2235 domain-containing protein [Paraburkholderia dilworthii]